MKVVASALLMQEMSMKVAAMKREREMMRERAGESQIPVRAYVL